MGKFKVVIQKPAAGTVNYDPAEGPYAIEREALDPIGAEIVEVPAKTEEEFLAAAQDADAIIARNRRISATIIKGLKKCKVIGLSSVGADTVDVDAATEAGIVVTNCPDVFIDEVADHTMAMFLAAHRRLRQMHQLVTVDRLKESYLLRSIHHHLGHIPAGVGCLSAGVDVFVDRGILHPVRRVKGCARSFAIPEIFGSHRRAGFYSA